MIKNIKLPVTFRRESSVSVSYHFFEMFIELLSESCEEGEEFLCWATKMSQYFENKFVQISLNFSVKTNSYRIRNASFLLAIFGKCTPGNYCNDY